MRTLVLTICFFIPSLSFGQMTLDERFSTDACICLDSLKSHGLNEQNFTDCFEQALQQDSMLLLEEAKKKYGDTSYEVGYKLGRELAERISVSLIYTCETYYNLMDTLRYSELRNLNKDSLEKTIEVLNKTDPNKRDIDFYTERGTTYFQLMNLDMALPDFDKAIKLDTNALQSIYFKAWSLEIKKKYDEAIQLYKKLALLTQKSEFFIFAAIAERKKNGM